MCSSTQVVIAKGDVALELTCRQIIGLCDAAKRSLKGQVGFVRHGHRIVLGLKVLIALRRRLEKRFFDGGIPERVATAIPKATTPQAADAVMVRTSTAPAQGGRRSGMSICTSALASADSGTSDATRAES